VGEDVVDDLGVGEPVEGAVEHAQVQVGTDQIRGPGVAGVFAEPVKGSV
jgi:hypothetical protein